MVIRGATTLPKHGPKTGGNETVWQRVVDKALSYQAIRKLRWSRPRALLQVFTYHRIGDASGSPFDRDVHGCKTDLFREHIRFLQERFDVIGIDDLIRIQESKQSPNRPTALITIDEGYIDSYTIAYPILKELGAKAVFYPPTEYLDSTIIPWWDETAWTLRNATVPSIRLGGSDLPFPLDPASTERSIRRVLTLVKSRTTVPMKEQLAEIRAACAPRRSIGDLNERLFMSWDQLKEMSDGGMDVGSHTHTHAILSHLDLDAQARELVLSKEILEARLGRPIESVAYPVGTRISYDLETCRIAREAGYKIGFNFIARANPFPLENPHDLFRHELVW